MKNNQRRMAALLKMLSNIELFYSISAGTYSNTLQGEFNPALVVELSKLKFKSVGYNINGYAEFQRGIFTITLT